MTGVANAHTAKVNSEDIECGIGTALEDASQTTYERVCSVGGHSIDHHTSRPTTRERFHKGSRQSSYEVGIQTTGRHTPRDAISKGIHSTRSTKNTDSNENSDEVRYYSYCSLETFLSTLDEGIIDILLLTYGSNDETVIIVIRSMLAVVVETESIVSLSN